MSDVLVLNGDAQLLSAMPLSIIDWQTAIRLLTLDKVRAIKSYDDWVVRSPSITMHVPSIVMCTEYLHWNRKVKYNRNNVFLRDNYTCQLQTTYKCRRNHGKGHPVGNLTIDHVVPRSLGGKTTWKNVTTACKDCNSVKGNDATIKPKNMPIVPSYYELIAKRQNMPISVKDLEWLDYLNGWDPELVWYHPPKGKSVKLTDYLENSN